MFPSATHFGKMDGYVYICPGLVFDRITKDPFIYYGYFRNRPTSWSNAPCMSYSSPQLSIANRTRHKRMDGSKIVSGSGDKTVKVWDAVTGTVLQTLKGHTSGRSFGFTPYLSIMMAVRSCLAVLIIL